jgi:hypothetical protein
MTHLLPCDTHRQMPQRALSPRYCCRCLRGRPTKDGRNAGVMFTCAECLESLAKAEGPK